MTVMVLGKHESKGAQDRRTGFGVRQPSSVVWRHQTWV